MIKGNKNNCDVEFATPLLRLFPLGSPRRFKEKKERK